MEGSDKELFRQIGDQSKDVYFILDAARHHFDYVNSAFATVWGINPQTVINNPLALLNSVVEEDKEYIINCFRDFNYKLRETKCTFRINYDEDTLKYIKVSLYPEVLNGQLKRIAGIAEDVTVVQQNIFYGEKINARKNSTLEILAHDLKGPLGTINMMASAIKREAQLQGQDKDRILQSVKFIQDMCARNIALIRSLVNQEFLESAEVLLRKERADLVFEIRDVIEQYKKSEEYMAKTFILNCSLDKLFIQLDSLKFIQVINNLISNAIKFTLDNGIIEVGIEEEPQTVLVTVSDNGIGIPQDMQPYLFDKFTRARRNGLRGEEPVGLGMSVIKTIVELHGGQITFESEENKGSRFFVRIPKK